MVNFTCGMSWERERARVNGDTGDRWPSPLDSTATNQVEQKDEQREQELINKSTGKTLVFTANATPLTATANWWKSRTAPDPVSI